MAVQALVPFGRLSDGRINGAGLENAHGFGDPYLSVVIWPYQNAEQGTDIAVASYTQPPLGGEAWEKWRAPFSVYETASKAHGL